jgi:RNase H-fold protein (predicted Holliday junction resolvase)
MRGIFALKSRIENELLLPVLLEPEFMTSVQAERSTEGEMIDASSAALILQSYLDKQKNKRDQH